MTHGGATSKLETMSPGPHSFRQTSQPYHVPITGFARNSNPAEDFLRLCSGR